MRAHEKIIQCGFCVRTENYQWRFFSYGHESSRGGFVFRSHRKISVVVYLFRRFMVFFLVVDYQSLVIVFDGVFVYFVISIFFINSYFVFLIIFFTIFLNNTNFPNSSSFIFLLLIIVLFAQSDSLLFSNFGFPLLYSYL